MRLGGEAPSATETERMSDLADAGEFKSLIGSILFEVICQVKKCFTGFNSQTHLVHSQCYLYSARDFMNNDIFLPKSIL